LPFELHPETPPEGAPKPFPPEQWPAIRERLIRTAQMVGLPIDPPSRNYNSRFALETAELIRARQGDDASGKFHGDVSRAFFTQQADIAQPSTIVPLAEHYGVSAADVERAWREHRYAATVDDFIGAAHRAGVTGVPAMAWPNRIAVMGMQPPEKLVRALRT
jgi:predicted DsbA family dithiol-disulfide isomerase